jgi:prepilin-type N-terminal cleavage/methylation domain-containing protein
MSFAIARRGFSLIELVIVVVIIGIIAAIAIPRMSRGAAGAGDSALNGDLATLRKAIDLYQTEHAGTYPSGTAANVISQLTGYTNDAGTVGTQGDGVSIYGPYLRSVPPVPVGANKGGVNFSVVTGASTAFAYVSTAGVGWWYNSSTGDIRANCKDSDTDVKGTAYNTY